MSRRRQRTVRRRFDVTLDPADVVDLIRGESVGLSLADDVDVVIGPPTTAIEAPDRPITADGSSVEIDLADPTVDDGDDTPTPVDVADLGEHTPAIEPASETGPWCLRCGAGPFAGEAGAKIHHGHVHDGDLETSERLPAVDDLIGEPEAEADEPPQPVTVAWDELVPAIERVGYADADVDLPGDWTADEVRTLVERYERRPYLFQVADHLGTSEKRARVITHKLGIYDGVKEGEPANAQPPESDAERARGGGD